MRTDKDLLLKGVKYLAYTVALMFSAPIVIYQAFKNQENILYWPVLIVGFILAIAAIAMGFYSIKVILDSIFGKKQPKSEENITPREPSKWSKTLKSLASRIKW